MIILLWLMASSLLLSDTLTIDKEQHTFDDFKMQRYEDKTSLLNFEQIQQVNNFSDVSNNISEGYRKSVLWYKFDVVNTLDRDVKYIVNVTEKYISEVDLYIVAQERVIHHKSGNSVPFEERVIQSPSSRFPLYLKRGEKKTVYLRLKSIISTLTAVKVMDEHSLVKSDLLTNQLFGLFFGGMVVLLIYNLFIYLSIRETIYLYYISYIGAFLAWQLVAIEFPLLEGIYGDTVNRVILLLSHWL